MNISISKQTGRHRSRILITSIGATLVLMTSAPSSLFAAAPPAPIAVNCTGNPANDPLQPAINSAPDGSTLEITGTCVGRFRIDKSLVLQEKAKAVATLFGGGVDTVLTILNPNKNNKVPAVVIKNLTITGGATKSCGGGIQNGVDLSCLSQASGNNGGSVRGGALSMIGVDVIGNHADLSGGGVYNSLSGTITITSTTIAGNSSGSDTSNSSDVPVDTGNGSTSAPGGGGGFANAGTAIVSNSIFAGNSAVGGSTDGTNTYGGGGISNTGAITLSGSSMIGNQSKVGGGMRNSAGKVTMTNCSVRGNKAEEGGGINNSTGSVTLNSTQVIGNQAVGGLAIGGGVKTEDGSFTLNSSVVTGNSATDNAGILDLSNATRTNSTVTGNLN